MLTPTILRRAADMLCYHAGDPGFMYSCDAIRVAGRGNEAVAEYHRLMFEHQVVVNDGEMGMGPLPAEGYHDEFERRQAIRFMFLEFLALAMEDRYGQEDSTDVGLEAKGSESPNSPLMDRDGGFPQLRLALLSNEGSA